MTLLIFDILLHSKSLKEISTVFIVNACYQNLSLIYLNQSMFVKNEYFRQISQKSDNFCIFKNPRNSSQIRTQAKQITQEYIGLIKFYIEATRNPFFAKLSPVLASARLRWLLFSILEHKLPILGS